MKKSVTGENKEIFETFTKNNDMVIFYNNYLTTMTN